MRPSQKSGRSRGKNNRNRGAGHSPNRVYESAGPEGKVRGTPQQVIDKYLSLARDAQLSGDRVTAENFLQHAEHYVRILIAMQEAANQDRRDQNQQPSGEQDDRDDDSGDQRAAASDDDESDGDSGRDQGRGQRSRRGSGRGAAEANNRAEPKPAAPEEQPAADGLAAIDAAEGASEIVETPENKPKTAERRPRRPRAKAAKPATKETDESSAEVAE